MADDKIHRLLLTNLYLLRNGRPIVVPDEGNPERLAYRKLLEFLGLPPSPPKPAMAKSESSKPNTVLATKGSKPAIDKGQ